MNQKQKIITIVQEQHPRHCWHNDVCLICQTSRELRHWKDDNGNWSESTAFFYTQPSGVGHFNVPVCSKGIPQDKIIEKATNYFGVNLFERTNKREVVFARQVTIELLWVFSYLSKSAIGKIFDLDHTTILSARKVVWNLCKTDPNIRQKVIDLETMIE